MSHDAPGPRFGTGDPHDFLEIGALLADEERMVRDTVRQFVGDKILPDVAEWFEVGTFPKELAKEMGALGLLGMHLEGYGCAGTSAVAYGIACQELEAGDSGARSFVSVQGSLAMFPIWRFGSEEQKQEWLPRMAAGEAIGCFGLTEPDSGSDPASMRTNARRDGGDWILNGTKMWITNGGIADVAVVWARVDDDEGRRILGFVVPTDTPGFTANDIHRKVSLRASITSELVLEDVRLPDSARLPEVSTMRGPLSCLNEARYGILWGAAGAGRACYEAALDYAKSREQFGVPIASFQLTQRKLVEMMVRVNKSELLALHLEALDHASHDFGPASPEARSVLRELDRGIADLMITIRRSAPDTVVLLVSDHGFIPVERFINLEAALREAGLITADTDGNVTDWRAAIWPMSGTAAIMLKHPDDAQDRAALANLLNRLAADPANGVAAVLDPQKIAARGGSRDAAFWVAFRAGFAAVGYAAGSLVQDSWLKGTHGYLPETPGMEALFIASGRGIAVGRDLGPIDMRRIAPTAARLLGVALRDAEATALPVRN